MTMPIFGHRPPPGGPSDDPIYRLRLLSAELEAVSKRLRKQVHEMTPERPQGDRNARDQ